MGRAVWSGAISFGLVNVPVKLYPAHRDHDLHFGQFAPDGSKVRYKRVSEKTGREVDYDDIQKGYELAKGRFVLFDPEELDQFDPESTRTIDIEDFVALEDIDPIYFERTYHLAPDGEAAAKAYAVLLKAMESTERVAIGRFVMRTKQYLAAIRPYDGGLALSSLLFDDEVIARSDLGALDQPKARVSEKELKMATQIVESLTTDWKPARYEDTYRERVKEFIEQKAEGDGGEVIASTPAENEGKVMDLMAALEASVKAAKKPKTSAKAAKKKEGRRTKAAESA